MKYHPLAEMFPLLEGEEFEGLILDIKENGQQYPITTYQSMILDGRNRYRACIEAGVEPRFMEYTGSDPVKHVISLNITRRHLNAGQRAVIAAKLITSKWGGERLGPKSPNGDLLTRSKAAIMLGVGTRTIDRAKILLNGGYMEELEDVMNGTKTLNQAYDEIAFPRESQQLEYHLKLLDLQSAGYIHRQIVSLESFIKSIKNDKVIFKNAQTEIPLIAEAALRLANELRAFCMKFDPDRSHIKQVE